MTLYGSDVLKLISVECICFSESIFKPEGEAQINISTDSLDEAVEKYPY